MAFVLIGASFSDMPLAQLEHLEHQASAVREALPAGVLISTCNRFEIYLDVDGGQPEINHSTTQAIEIAAKLTGLDLDYLYSTLHVSYGSAVAQHLYSVASGLDSMVVGEAEIAGQVRRSFIDAQDAGKVSADLNLLFQRALSVAKSVTTHTGLGEAGRSIITTGLDLFQSAFGPLSGAKVVLFGTGAYARVSVAALQRAGVAEIKVYSESGRAQQFSSNRQTIAVERGQLRSALASADLVVTASGSRSYSISFHLAKDVLALQQQLGLQAGLRIIDVALAKSVAPHAYELAEVTVFDLDYIHQHAPRRHSQAVQQAREIVLEAVAGFEAEQQARAVDPLIAALRHHVSGWVDEEVARVRSRSGDQTADEVAKSLARVTNALLHSPSVKAKQLAKDGNHSDYVKAVKTLFGIDLD